MTCGHTDRQYKPADMANRISQSYHPSLVNIPVILSPHGSPRIRPTSIGGMNKSKDMANRISQTYHSSMVNIPVIPSPHGSPRSRPTSIRMSSHPSLVNIPAMPSPRDSPRSRPSSIRMVSAHPSLVNIPIMPSPVPSPRSRPNSIHGSSQVSSIALDMCNELTFSDKSIYQGRFRPTTPWSISHSFLPPLLQSPRQLLSHR